MQVRLALRWFLVGLALAGVGGAVRAVVVREVEAGAARLGTELGVLWSEFDDAGGGARARGDRAEGDRAEGDGARGDGAERVRADGGEFAGGQLGVDAWAESENSEGLGKLEEAGGGAAAPFGAAQQPRKGEPSWRAEKGSRTKADPASGDDVVEAIFVPARRVLGLAERGWVPQAVPRRSREGGAEGLELRSVSALGLGLRDGDVIVRVAGVPVTDLAAVTSLVLDARRRRARTLSAEVERWVDGAPRRFRLVVEQPYP